MAKAPFKVCLEVVEPEGEAQSPWRLEYMIHSLHTGVTVRARDAWMLQGRAGDVRGDYMRRYLLIMLGLIGAFVKPVTSSLEEEAPTGCDMSLEEASDFLGVQAEDLTGMGVGVRFPQWWEKGARDALTLRGRVLGGMSGNAAAPAGDGEALALKWELALGGAVLSDGERSAVMDGRLPLMRNRGRWRFIDPNHLQAVRRHMESLPSEAGAAELVRLAVRDQYIDGFMDAPELERIYDSLRECRAHEPLSAPGSMNGSLRPYQSRGYSWLSFLSRLGLGACLADDMGLGKTVQALAMIQHRRDCGDRRPVLLVCPMSVMENWRQETGRFFPGMSTYVHHGRARDRGDDFVRGISGCAMVLTSYALLQREISLYQRVDWQGVVLDEAQNIKNPDTQQARAARAIKSEWRVVLTGTPIENHVGDLWSIMEFLVPGMLGSRRSFVNCYVKPIQEGRDAALMEDLRKMVAPFVLRRMKTDRDIAPDLPMKIETKVYCGLKREQVKLYSGVAEALTREIGGAQGIRRRGLVLAALTRAKQICDHPSLVMKDLDFGADRSAKLERLFSLAEEMHETGDKALIFTQYVEMGDILKHQLQERFGREVMFLHGSVFKDARDRMVRRFQEEPGPRFFVLSMKAGGVGLNLTGANHVVMYDRWWNPAVENQAIDRAYRIGQTRNVHVHIFCCRGTLEERIDELIASKKEVAGMVIESNDNWITELSDYELQRLLLLRPAAMEV
jgi:SNF2 family DNA or RNA helicase